MDTIAAIITATAGAIATILTSLLAFYKLKMNTIKEIHKLKMEERNREENRDDKMHQYYVDKIERIADGRIEKIVSALQVVNSSNTTLSLAVTKLCDSVDSQWKIQRESSSELTKAITSLHVELSKMSKN